MSPLRVCFRLLVLTLACACKPVAPSDTSVNALPEPQIGRLVYEAEARINPDSGSLAVRALLRYRVARPEEREVALLLNRSLTVHSVDGPLVREFSVQPSEFSPSWNLITVAFVDSVKVGARVDISLAYDGPLEMPGDGINRIAPEWVELGLDSQWFPVVSTFAEEMTGNLRVTLPPGWMLVASGSAAQEGDTFVVRNRVPQIDVAVSAAPTMQVVRRGRAEVHHRTAAGDAVEAVLDAAGMCVQELDARFGARDTFPVARIVLAERDGPGYARKNYIVLSNVKAGEPEAMLQFLCHEVSHYWTRSPGSFSPDHWISEALAEYSAALIVRQRFGDEAFARLRDKWEQGGRTAGPVWTAESTRRPSFQMMYRRAPWLLSKLEARIGTNAFAQFLARVMVDGAASTPQLLEALSAAAGADAAAWFRSELAAPGARPMSL